MDIPKFKIRPSAAGTIMAGTIGLTDKQKERIKELEARENGAGKPLTKNMVEELAALKEKQSDASISTGMKTYCKNWAKDIIYGRRKEIDSKYTYKGNAVEDASIVFMESVLNLPLCVKNEDRFKNEYMAGTPDVILPDEVIDVKNSFDHTTFPLFEDAPPESKKKVPNRDYYYQLQCYMELTGRPRARLVYLLMNAPEKVIQDEARRAFYSGRYETQEAAYDAMSKLLTYDDIPNHRRIKYFEFERDEPVIAEIKRRVLLCRTYIENELSPYFEEVF